MRNSPCTRAVRKLCNQRRLYDVALRRQIETVSRAAGYEPPLISTPEELPTEVSDG
jgi:hypothetical protein